MQAMESMQHVIPQTMGVHPRAALPYLNWHTLCSSTASPCRPSHPCPSLPLLTPQLPDPRPTHLLQLHLHCRQLNLQVLPLPLQPLVIPFHIPHVPTRPLHLCLQLLQLTHQLRLRGL